MVLAKATKTTKKFIYKTIRHFLGTVKKSRRVKVTKCIYKKITKLKTFAQKKKPAIKYKQVIMQCTSCYRSVTRCVCVLFVHIKGSVGFHFGKNKNSS